MHELSIAVSLIETASEHARRHNARRVNTIYLKLGPLAGVSEQALRSAFEIAREASPLADAKLDIERVPLIAFCPVCRINHQIPDIQRLRCPICDQPATKVITGAEMEVTGMEIVE